LGSLTPAHSPPLAARASFLPTQLIQRRIRATSGGRKRWIAWRAALRHGVGLRLSLGDTVRLDERRTLEYQTSYPNGPDCGGPCRFASLSFDVEES
jgi:hypothetical protein